MNQLDQTKIALLREASRTLNTVSKVKQENEEFVKCKRSYAHPEAIRTLYLQALDSLIEDGVMELVITNEYLDLYEVKQADVPLTARDLSKHYDKSSFEDCMDGTQSKTPAELYKKLRSVI